MLDEGTKTRTSLADQRRAAAARARSSAPGPTSTPSSVTLSALKANLDPSLDALRRRGPEPVVPGRREFERLQKQQLAGDPAGEGRSRSAWRCACFPRSSTATGHAYALPLTGSGYRRRRSRRSRASDLVEFHDDLVQAEQRDADRRRRHDAGRDPAEARGAVRGLEGRRRAEEERGAGRARKAAGRRLPHRPARRRSSRRSSPATSRRRARTRRRSRQQAMNTVLGGQFTSRVNMNLREDKHWSYGAGTLFCDARGQRPFLAYAPVQTDKTKESVAGAAEGAAAESAGERPVTRRRAARPQGRHDPERCPASGRRAARSLGSIGEIVRFGFPTTTTTTLRGQGPRRRRSPTWRRPRASSSPTSSCGSSSATARRSRPGLQGAGPRRDQGDRRRRQREVRGR